MEILAPRSVRLEFARKAEISADLRHRLMMEMNAKLRTEQVAAQEKSRRKDAEFAAAMEAAFATPHQIEAFTAKLDKYDTGTVQALMDNERDMVAVRERLGEMLLKAQTLPDGRRVFKDEQGIQVFDEFGTELKAEEIAPASIADDRPRWETFRDARKEEERLVEERKDLIDYQGKLDTARERTKEPTLTENELSALDKELGQAMPQRVRQLTGEPATDPNPDLAANPAPDNGMPPIDRIRSSSAPAAFQL